MVFSDLLFIFLFLFLCIVSSTMAPNNRVRNWILLGFSLFFYAWGGLWLLPLLCGMTFIAYIGALKIDKARMMVPRSKVQHGMSYAAALMEKERDPNEEAKKVMKLTLALTVGLSLFILAFFKYTGFLCGEFQKWFGVPQKLPGIVLPMGISFYTFQLISYVVDVYRGEVEAQKSYPTLLLYAGLFHQCIAGPIVRYKDISREFTERVLTLNDCSKGVSRFAIGLAKKVLLADALATVADKLVPVNGAGIASASALTVWIGSIAYMLQLYLDFSAYSDMAIGMGLMSGFHYLENFRYPYMAESVTDFWRRWHISLSSFFKDYVYIPLGGNRRGIPRQYLNLLVVWVLTGIWHGAGWNFLLWGLFYFVILCIEKRILDPKKTVGRGLYTARRLLTLFLVFIGWILFRYTDMGVMGTVLKGLFCLNGNPFVDLNGGITLLNNCFLLPAAMLASTPILPVVKHLLDKKAYGHPKAIFLLKCLSVILPLALIVLSACCLAGDHYSPFLYTQF